MERRHRTVTAVFWSAVTTWGQQILTIGLLITLARLLEPDQFGIVALAGIFVFITVEIVQSMITQTLVQAKTADELHFSSIFWLGMAFSTVISLLFVMAADPIAAHFDEPILAEMVPWMSVIVMLTTAEVVQQAWLMRALRFKPLAIRSVVGTLVSGSVAIGLASSGYGAWSMLIQQMVYAAVSCAITWYFSSWRPRFEISLSHCSELFSSGRYIGSFSILSYIVNRLDVFIIGTFLGPTFVGLYNVGQRVVKMLLTGVVGSLIRALLPALSQLQDKPASFKNAYLRCYQYSMIVAVPLFLGVSIMADEIVAVLLGAKWSAAIPILRIIALAGIAQAVGMLQWTGLMAQGRFSTMLKIGCVAPFVFGGLMTAGLHVDGIVGLAVGYLCASWIIDGAATVMMARSINISLRQYMQVISPIVASAITMMGMILICRILLWGSGDFITLPVASLMGALCYAGALRVFAPTIISEVRTVIVEAIVRRRSATI